MQLNLFSAMSFLYWSCEVLAFKLFIYIYNLIPSFFLYDMVDGKLVGDLSLCIKAPQVVASDHCFIC